MNASKRLRAPSPGALGAAGPVLDDAVVDLVHTAIVASGAGGSVSRWTALLATGAIVRDGPGRFFCRARVDCKGYTKSLANDSSVGSSNAFMHLLLCGPQHMSKELLLEAVTKDRAHLRSEIRLWVARPPPPASGLSAFLQSKAQALSASSADIMSKDMGFKQKLSCIAGIVAGGIAASGLPLNSASNDLVACIIKAFDQTCPIPSPDMIARRIPMLMKVAVEQKVKAMARIEADLLVPSDFELAWQWDMWSADRAAEADSGFATSSFAYIDQTHSRRDSFFGVQHVPGRHDSAAIEASIEDLFLHPWGSDGSPIHPRRMGIVTSDTGSNGKKALKEYETQQRQRLLGLPPEATFAIAAANAVKREFVCFWQPCACHVAELAVKQDVLNPKSTTYDEVAVVATARKVLDEFAAYFRGRCRIAALKREIAKIAPFHAIEDQGASGAMLCRGRGSSHRLLAPSTPQPFPSPARRGGTRPST